MSPCRNAFVSLSAVSQISSQASWACQKRRSLNRATPLRRLFWKERASTGSATLDGLAERRGEGRGRPRSAQIARPDLWTLFEHRDDAVVDSSCCLGLADVMKHEDRRLQQRYGIGPVLPGDIGRTS